MEFGSSPSSYGDTYQYTLPSQLRSPRYTQTLLAVPPPKGLSLRSGEAYAWIVEEASTCITSNQFLSPINNSTKRAYRVLFAAHEIRRLTVLYPAQKGAHSIPSRESQLPLGRVINSGMSQRMPSPQSDTVPTSDPRQVHQQANPLTHWPWTYGY